MSPAAITLACLDMAGTTVTDDGAVQEAFSAALSAGGLDLDAPAGLAARTYVQETMGQSKIEVFGAIFGGDARAASVANRRFEESYAHSVAVGAVGPLEGAEAAIDRLRASGVKVCLTTGFSPSTRDVLIDALGWRDRVDLALSPADAGRGRPFPDMILHAVVVLEIEDVACVAVVGDTASDLISGRRAGAGMLIGVLTGAHGRSELEAAGATHIVDSVAAVPALLRTDPPGAAISG